jgi:hypothetical protein
VNRREQDGEADGEPGEEDQQLRRTGAELDDRDVSIAFVVGMSRMLMKGMLMNRMVVVGGYPRFREGRSTMNMSAFGRADVAVGVHVHMQAGELGTEQAQAGQRQQGTA